MMPSAFVITHKFLFDCLTNGARTHFKLLTFQTYNHYKIDGNFTLGSVVMLRGEGESLRKARRLSDQFQLGKQCVSDSAVAGRRTVGEVHTHLLGVALSSVVSEM